MVCPAPDGRVISHTLIQFPVGTHHPPPGSTVLDRQRGSTG
jgi:hypothetical protein